MKKLDPFWIEKLEQHFGVDEEVNVLQAKIYTENFMRDYRKIFRIVEHNFNKATAEEFKRLVIDKFKNL